MDAKLDKILEKVTELQIDMAAVKVDVSHHIKRSDAAEDRLERQDKTIMRLWMAVVALASGGIGANSSSFVKWLSTFMGA